MIGRGRSLVMVANYFDVLKKRNNYKLINARGHSTTMRGHEEGVVGG